jgi:hypothetical protein
MEPRPKAAPADARRRAVRLRKDVAAASPAKRWVFGWAVDIGRRTSQLAQARKPSAQSYARVKKFAVLPVELTEETGELTVAEKYHALLESLYD